ncbi:MAG: DUF6660 family protein [Bacteroidota bacterium]
MRFLAFIMAFIILAISVVPCADQASITSGGQGNEITAQHADHPLEDHADECSPLCTCSCCAGFAILGTPSKISGVQILPSKQYSSLLISPTFSIHFAIWQPPRVV